MTIVAAENAEGRHCSSSGDPMTRSVCAGGVYFAVVFALGFALGVFRVLITGPKLGQAASVLLELPIILIVSWFAARCCVGGLSVAPRATERLTMGFVAFGLTMVAELSLSVMLFGHTIPEHFATYAHLLGLIGLAAQLLFALFPYVQIMRGSTATGVQSFKSRTGRSPQSS